MTRDTNQYKKVTHRVDVNSKLQSTQETQTCCQKRHAIDATKDADGTAAIMAYCTATFRFSHVSANMGISLIHAFFIITQR